MTSADLVTHYKKQPIGFACGLLSLVIAGLLYYRSGKIEENQALYETTAAEAAKILSNVSTAKNLPDQLAEIQAHVKDLDARIVHAGQMAVNQQFFYRLEKENDVKMLDMRQNGVIKNPSATYIPVPFSVTIQGSFKQVMIFLNRLENGRPFCRFSTISFAKVGAVDANTPATAMSLTINLELLGQP